MSNIKKTSALSTKEDVLEFYKQTLPKVEDIMKQIECGPTYLGLTDKTLRFKTKELNKEQWQKQYEQGIKQAQQLAPNESTNPNLSFELDSVHCITSNLDPDKIINIQHAKSIFQDYMIRELKGRLESGITVSVNRIIRRTADNKRVWSEVEYTIVKIEDSKLPATVVSSSASSNNSTNKIKVPGYTFPSSVNARYHVSLGDLLKMYGKASLQHLYNLNEVASLDTAKR